MYCVGTAKSGTHSIAEMFARHTRAAHEPGAGEVISKILASAEGQINRKEFMRWACKRARSLGLEVDSSQLNFFLLEPLLTEFPDSRFVLTIRDCYSWLDSFINHVLHYNQAGTETLRFRDFRFRAKKYSHAPEESVLKERGLHTLDGYLSYWAMHNERTVYCVPPEQLLIVRTDQIRQRAFEIAEFGGFPSSTVDLERTHSFKNPKKFNLLRQIDCQFLENKVQKYCRPLMQRFFPEIKSLDDTKL